MASPFAPAHVALAVVFGPIALRNDLVIQNAVFLPSIGQAREAFQGCEHDAALRSRHPTQALQLTPAARAYRPVSCGPHALRQALMQDRAKHDTPGHVVIHMFLAAQTSLQTW